MTRLRNPILFFPAPNPKSETLSSKPYSQKPQDSYCDTQLREH